MTYAHTQAEGPRNVTVAKKSNALKTTHKIVYAYRNFFFDPEWSAIAPSTGDDMAIMSIVMLPAHPHHAVPSASGKPASTKRLMKYSGNNAVTISTEKLVLAKSYMYYDQRSFRSVGIACLVSILYSPQLRL